jgi:hypothetical protein
MEGHFYVLVASPGIIDFPMFASESHFRFFMVVFSWSFWTHESSFRHFET